MIPHELPARSGRLRTSPPPRADHSPAAAAAAPRRHVRCQRDAELSLTGLPAAGSGAPQLPEALRGFLERLGADGVPGGLGGLAKPASEPLPEGAQFLGRSFANEAGSRAYKLYVPASYHGQALPLVVMLHGCTQSPDDFAAGTRMNKLAEEHACLVVYPAQDASANVSKCWNWFSVADQQRDQGEPSLIAGITRQVMRDDPVDPRGSTSRGCRPGGRGRHHGADLSRSLCRDRRAFRARRRRRHATCRPPSQRCSGAAACRRAIAVRDGISRRIVPTIVFHGDSDTTVSPRNGDQVIAQARSAIGATSRRRQRCSRVRSRRATATATCMPTPPAGRCSSSG